MAESDGLENRCGYTPTVGSNPTPSARSLDMGRSGSGGGVILADHLGRIVADPQGVVATLCADVFTSPGRKCLLRGSVLQRGAVSR